MGNAQEKPPGSGGGAAKADQATAGSGTRSSRGGNSGGKPHVAPEKGVVNGTPRGNSPARGQEKKDSPAMDRSYLDAPAGALPLHLARLKNEGNHLFKHGQFGDALEKYTQAIEGCAEAGIDSPEDLCILYSNRAACYLKDGNSTDCIQDCNKALELQPYSLKPLLRRAMAYESLERYRKAYVDYKTVLQIDTGVQAAHDSVHRLTKMLIEQDGPEWRQKLPEIPVVPLSVQQQHREKPISNAQAQARAARAAHEEALRQIGDLLRGSSAPCDPELRMQKKMVSCIMGMNAMVLLDFYELFFIQGGLIVKYTARRKEARFTLLKQEGNSLVKKGLFQDALEKYNECLTIKADECSVHTNRAICLLRLNRFEEAKQDCDSALQLEPNNKKAFYRRALAFKGLQDYLSASSDLQEVLRLDPNVREAELELEVVTGLLRQSLMDNPVHRV